ncbi:hypothetical protein KR51_00023030 [Rubidibacter lacunae KORDI 51-2]|uniref:Uncharacterized protein n=1 Tax=Rubidibacter lacunae KORDI 51-2 TaxID=582515 RepID=U5DHF2_9CHRO|nr:hypothetical protein KR51_00023030 [Rubidibacter lacunae KORDI 51-2]
MASTTPASTELAASLPKEWELEIGREVGEVRMYSSEVRVFKSADFDDDLAVEDAISRHLLAGLNATSDQFNADPS